MRKFEIYNAARRNPKPCASITYDEHTSTAYTELLCDKDTPAEKRDLPLLFELFAQQGIFEIGHEWTTRWIEDRIPPAGRQNIGEVLRANDLNVYSPIDLFAKSYGRSSHDDFLAREVSPCIYAVMKIPETMLNPCTKFGRILKAARLKQNISQRELAELTGINQSVISKIESGQANPTLATCDELISACGQSLF